MLKPLSVNRKESHCTTLFLWPASEKTERIRAFPILATGPVLASQWIPEYSSAMATNEALQRRERTHQADRNPRAEPNNYRVLLAGVGGHRCIRTPEASPPNPR